MIAVWMLWAIAASLLLALAAHAAEGALRVAGRPTRAAWTAALVLGALLPPAAWLQARRAAEPPAPAVSASTEHVAAGEPGDPGALDALLARATVSAPPALARLDGPLVALWALLSAAALARLALAGRRLRRARAEWRRETVDGVAVLVAGRTGPAVAGVLRPTVVLPEWALESDPALVRLMLAHEREHVRAGDPRLLAAGAVLAALVSWNPGVWLMLRRLRLAVEADCDRRVLRRHPDVRRYGGLLLEVGRRLPAAEPLPLAALASSPSHLERRIRLMTMSRPRHPLAAGLGLAAAAGALLLVACEMPRPTEVTPAGEMPLASIRSGGAYTVTGSVTPAAVREAVAVILKDSDATARLGQPVDLYFIADATGRVVHAEYSRQRTARLGVTGGAAADTDVARVRARMPSRGTDTLAVSQVRVAPVPGAVASLDPNAIRSVEVLKAGPGEIVADSANVIWVALKEGATLESAQAAGEALREVRARRERAQVEARAQAQLVPKSSNAASDSLLDEMVRRARLPSSDPLYIVDGVIVPEGRTYELLRDLDPDRIDEIEVLKGAAAARLYGERAENGIIRITTKKPPR